MRGIEREEGHTGIGDGQGRWWEGEDGAGRKRVTVRRRVLHERPR